MTQEERERFRNIATAQRRAEHFGLRANRSRLSGWSGAEVATRNYGWLCDTRTVPVDVGMVCYLDRWAAALNRVADAERVMDNPVTRWCFGRFLAATMRVCDFRKL